jgi:hypothetical protein
MQERIRHVAGSSRTVGNNAGDRDSRRSAAGYSRRMRRWQCRLPMPLCSLQEELRSILGSLLGTGITDSRQQSIRALEKLLGKGAYTRLG